MTSIVYLTIQHKNKQKTRDFPSERIGLHQTLIFFLIYLRYAIEFIYINYTAPFSKFVTPL